MMNLAVRILFSFILLIFVSACSDAKIRMKSNKSTSKTITATGANPINAQAAGATVQTTVGGYTAALKISSMPIKNSTASGYQFNGKVVIQ